MKVNYTVYVMSRNISTMSIQSTIIATIFLEVNDDKEMYGCISRVKEDKQNFVSEIVGRTFLFQ